MQRNDQISRAREPGFGTRVEHALLRALDVHFQDVEPIETRRINQLRNGDALNATGVTGAFRANDGRPFAAVREGAARESELLRRSPNSGSYRACTGTVGSDIQVADRHVSFVGFDCQDVRQRIFSQKIDRGVSCIASAVDDELDVVEISLTVLFPNEGVAHDLRIRAPLAYPRGVAAKPWEQLAELIQSSFPCAAAPAVTESRCANTSHVPASQP